MQAIKEVVPGFDLGDEIVVYAKDQPEYLQLPCHKQPDGTITIRWKLTWKERFLIVLNGCFWHQVLTFNQKLQPIKISVDCPIFGHAMGDKEI